MGRLAKQIQSDIAALEHGESAITESPIGDRGEPRPPAGQANGRILLRISRREHEVLVREAAEQGVSLNHYLTEIVCSRARQTAIASNARVARRESKPSTVSRRSTTRP
jgi:HicB family